jgi:hypothetical protein
MEKRKLDKAEVMAMFDSLVVDMNVKPPEVKDREAKAIMEAVNSGETTYDGWSKAFEANGAGGEESLSKGVKIALTIIGEYSPMSMAGIKNSIFRVCGEKRGAGYLQELESRRMIRVTEDEMGRTIRWITEKGIKALGEDYQPKKK